MIRWMLRSMLPKSVRVRLRSSAFMRKMAARFLGGERARPFPNSNYQLHFDGYRNFGLSTGDLDQVELEERNWVRQHFASHLPKVIWDVGANVGIWSLFFNVLTDAKAEVRCFEPDPVNLRYLEMNRDRNKIKNWIVRPIGLSDRSGSASFYSDVITGCTGSLESTTHFSEKFFNSKSVEISIQLTTMDEEIAAGATPPDFIKLDVESHELAALRGGRRLLTTHRPTLIFESSANYQELGQFFQECEYDLFDLAGRKLDQPEFYTIARPR